MGEEVTAVEWRMWRDEKRKDREAKRKRDSLAVKMWADAKTPELRLLLKDRYPHLFVGKPVL